MSDASSRSPAAHHRLAVRAKLGSLILDVSTEFSAPWTVLFGPSGSGKSSLLRALCGSLVCEQLHFSRLTPTGTWLSLANTASILPPEERHLAYAPQAGALFPHLTVEENVRFGAGLFAKRSKDKLHAAGQEVSSDIKDRTDEACELFELNDFRRRHPAQLSGGEGQRVNLARAFARPGAQLLLLDEPFSGLDRPLRDRILPRLHSALATRNLPVISVTHDIEEALLLEAEVLRLGAGCLLAQGPAREVLHRESTELLRTLHPLP